MGTTAAQKKLFFNLRKLKGQMQAIEEGDLSPEQVTKIATRLGVPEEEVVNMNRRLAAPDSSLNARSRPRATWSGRTGWSTTAPTRRLASPRARSSASARPCWRQALKQLTDRERHIIVERRLVDEPKTLEDLSAKYGISRERVRQIEVRAFDKLQKAMKNMVVEAANRSGKQLAAAAPERSRPSTDTKKPPSAALFLHALKRSCVQPSAASRTMGGKLIIEGLGHGRRASAAPPARSGIAGDRRWPPAADGAR